MKSKLSDICHYVMGKVDVSELDNSTYISTENMLPDKGGVTEAATLPTIAQTQIYEQEDVLVSNIRPYFKKIWFANRDGGCSNDVLVFRVNEGVEPDFLYYVLADDKFFNYSMATSKGTKMPRGDKKALMEYEVPDLNIDTQRKVASLLGDIDEKIKINNEINKNLEQQMDILYARLFIRNADPAWTTGTISDLGDVVGGSTPSKKVDAYYTDHGIAWITPKDLSRDHSKFLSHGEVDITELGLSKSSTVIMPAGTVLFSSRAPIGYIAIAANELCTNQGFKSVIPHDGIGTAFIYCFLKANLQTIESMASGSTFKEVSGSTMKLVPTVIPDQRTMSQFNEFAMPLLQQQQNLEAENRCLANLRESLLPKLMSGEIDASKLAL
ncbi:restriction endonuclease subunit S [Clostridium fermenticellae]|uniref:Restriction endonuclease subunit S n=1 Tax=Clostridium fermenticellae TaxID=2068654 RepID=A0A386H1K6_9CLOT|nr:restriction endonuclease subunit S [Clostridium fermenticellae]AYD39425.1 restriction endonuclease subunit S [Clostridium fermenticellae]